MTSLVLRSAGLVAAAFALTLAMGGTASAETTGGPDPTTSGDSSGSDTGGSAAPTSTLSLPDGPFTAGVAFTATVDVVQGSAELGSIELLINDQPDDASCGDGTFSCDFELTLEAGSYTLQGRALDVDGAEGLSDAVMIEVDPATDPPEETTGPSDPPMGDVSTGPVDEPAASDDDGGGGCSVATTGAPVGPLAALMLFGLFAHRRR